MAYSVKEIYYTLQGEGANTGRAAVFCRFSGCNLWSGREEDRASATCDFCDTDFLGTNGPNGGRFESAQLLADSVRSAWTGTLTEVTRPLVVCTGGEPLLQLDETLVRAFHDIGFEVAIETNGTRVPPPSVDWICMSPKAGAECVLLAGDELKLVYPQPGAEPEKFGNYDFRHFYLQPMDGPRKDINIRLTIEYCLRNPQWKLSLQTHKIIGIL